jgi:hypothetical protein
MPAVFASPALDDGFVQRLRLCENTPEVAGSSLCLT